MSYSDYGAYVWRDGVCYPEGVDATFSGIRAPHRQPLLDSTGLKLDVLANAYAQQGVDYGNSENVKLDFVTQHPGHMVLGGGSVGVVGFKGSVTFITQNDERVRYPGSYDDWDAAPIHLDVDGNKFGAYYIKYPHSEGTFAYLLDLNGVFYCGVCGYGLGGKWWLTSDGREYVETGTFYAWGLQGWGDEENERDIEMLRKRGQVGRKAQRGIFGIKRMRPWWRERDAKKWVGRLLRGREFPLRVRPEVLRLF